jgi:hypothetical protein
LFGLDEDCAAAVDANRWRQSSVDRCCSVLDDRKALAKRRPSLAPDIVSCAGRMNVRAGLVMFNTLIAWMEISNTS